MLSFPKNENPFENACQRILDVFLNQRMRRASFDETMPLEMYTVKAVMGIVEKRKRHLPFFLKKKILIILMWKCAFAKKLFCLLDKAV